MSDVSPIKQALAKFPSFGGRAVKFCEIEIASLCSPVTGAMLKCRHCEGRSDGHSRGDPKQSHNLVII
jgi:hypothetical protein